MLTRVLLVTIALVLTACDGSKQNAVADPIPVLNPKSQMCIRIIAAVSEIVAADRLPGGRKHEMFQIEARAIANDVGPIWWDNCLKTVTPEQDRCYQEARNPKQAKKCAGLAKSATGGKP